jgi:hypothetical protein
MGELVGGLVGRWVGERVVRCGYTHGPDETSKSISPRLYYLMRTRCCRRAGTAFLPLPSPVYNLTPSPHFP